VALGGLSVRVLALTVERFAWHARDDLGAEVLLGFPEEDAVLDALAQFLWEHRHLGRGGRAP